MVQPKAGDSVRVVIEGTFVNEGEITLESGESVTFEDAEIEVVESFAEQFVPGDRVQNKNGPRFEATLLDTGYISHNYNGQPSHQYHPHEEGSEETFNANTYELIYRAEFSDE